MYLTWERKRHNYFFRKDSPSQRVRYKLNFLVTFPQRPPSTDAKHKLSFGHIFAMALVTMWGDVE